MSVHGVSMAVAGERNVIHEDAFPGVSCPSLRWRRDAGIHAALPAQAIGQPTEVGSSGDLGVAFLAKAPVMDGALDPEVAELPVVPLRVFKNSTGDAPAAAVSARLAYGADFLYLAIEAAQDRIQCRDRAYQKGDGIILALASPRDGDAATDEFQVLGFSPQAKARRSWQYAFTWYKDRDWVGFPPLEGAAFAWSHSAGTACFEVLVPWSAVAPYHPWFRSEIGLNIGYSQAVGTQGIIEYQLVPDPLLQYEVSPRLYRRAAFAVPSRDRAVTCGVSLEASHATAGTPIALRVASSGVRRNRPFHGRPSGQSDARPIDGIGEACARAVHHRCTRGHQRSRAGRVWTRGTRRCGNHPAPALRHPPGPGLVRVSRGAGSAAGRGCRRGA